MKRILLSFSIVCALILSGCSCATETTTEKPSQTGEDETTENYIPDGFTATGVYTDDSAKINHVKELLGDTAYYYMDSKEGKDVDNLIQKRIDEIENTKSYPFKKSDEFILGETYTGREFYIDSENGNDENDALTPQTAWKTTKRLDDEARFGDIVYFKRGCVYYNIEHNPQNGITYTSYGEGFKPVITGTPEYVNDPDKWELFYDEYGWTKTDTVTVDHSLDENLNKYGYLKDWLVATWEEAVIEEELTENLMFIDRWDNKVVEDLSVPNEEMGAQDIYLRCDEGNPAEVFSNILMATACYNGDGTKYCFDTWCKSSFVFDNISIIGAIDVFLSHCDDTIVKDCEFAYCGQNVKSMSVEEME